VTVATLSIFCLAVVAAMCAIGALHPRFNDNLLQRVGMGAICLANIALAHHVMQLDRVDPSCLVLAGGMLAFAVGTAQKVCK